MKLSNEVTPKILLHIPFSYLRVHKKAIGKAKTVLDLGCGDGTFMKNISQGERWEITGVDIFEKSLDIARKKGVYKELIKGDLVKICQEFLKKGRKFDVVFCSQAIEHITRKKGEKLLELTDKLARKRAIFTTPRGFMEQPHEFIGNNLYQYHKSGWDIDDFRRRNYVVKGMGFLPVWSEHGWGRSRNKPIAYLGKILSFITAPLVYFFSNLGQGMLVIKNYER